MTLSCHRSEDCAPGDDWTLIFTNHLDAAAFDPASIAIEPELDQAKVTLFRHTDGGRRRAGVDRRPGRRQGRVVRNYEPVDADDDVRRARVVEGALVRTPEPVR